MEATSSAAPPLPAELSTDSAALEQLRALLIGGGVDLALRTEQGEGFETRSGRISRRPHHPITRPSEEPKPPSSNGEPQLKKPRGPGRPPKFTAEERAVRRRERNKEAAVISRQKTKAKLEAAAGTAKELEERTRECEVLRERCAQLEARVNQLQAQIVGLGHSPAPPSYVERAYVPPPDTPPKRAAGPSRPPKVARIREPTPPTPPRATPAESPMPPPPAPSQPPSTVHAPMAPPPLPPMSEAEAAAAAAAVLSSGFNAAAFATPPAVSSSFSTPTVLTPLTDAAMATHTQETTSPVDLTGAYTGFEGGDDYDTMSLSALFNFDDLPEDAADEDFVPPTSPKPGESSSDEEDEDEGDEDEEDDSGKEKAEEKQHRGQKRPREDDAGDEAEDMFLPIRDVPIPIEEVYSEAMAALGVNSKEELTKVVASIVQGASQGHVSPEAVEVLRRLVTIAEAQGMYAKDGESSSR